jgi:hypothetical protein
MLKQVRVPALFAILALCLSLGLHLRDPDLIEYKWDEAYMFQSTQAAHGLDPYPSLGMRSGAAGLANPGLSVWVFSAPARLLALDTPEALARFVGLLFVLALAVLVAYALGSSRLDARERGVWLWGAALLAVNPPLLLLTRKIWAQSLLPVFVVAICVLWCERARHPLLRFLLVLLAVLIGQIHMSGFFLGAVIVLLELREAWKGRASWAAVLAGISVGVAPMLPWLLALVSPEGGTRLGQAVGMTGFPEALKFRFWSYLVGFGSGLDTAPDLGEHALGFLARPSVLLPQLLGLALLATLLFAALRRLCASPRPRFGGFARFDASAPDVQLLWIALVFCAVLMTVSNVRIHRHYLLVVTPMIGFAWARLALAHFPRRASWGLGLFVLLQASVAWQLLSFIDSTRGNRDFGIPYRHQSDPERAALP